MLSNDGVRRGVSLRLVCYLQLLCSKALVYGMYEYEDLYESLPVHYRGQQQQQHTQQLYVVDRV